MEPKQNLNLLLSRNYVNLALFYKNPIMSLSLSSNKIQCCLDICSVAPHFHLKKMIKACKKKGFTLGFVFLFLIHLLCFGLNIRFTSYDKVSFLYVIEKM